MTALALLESLGAVGISVSSERGRLIVDAPAGAITSQLRAELVSKKAELIAALEMKLHPIDAIRLEAQKEIAGLLAIAYQRRAAIQRVCAGRNENTVDSGLASSGKSSVHGGVA